jgi:hypothetical protein
MISQSGLPQWQRKGLVWRLPLNNVGPTTSSIFPDFDSPANSGKYFNSGGAGIGIGTGMTRGANGNFGSSTNLDGFSAIYLPAQQGPQNALTQMAWINPTSGGLSGGFDLLTLNSDANGYSRLFIRTTGRLQVRLTQTAGTIFIGRSTSGTVLKANVAQHVAWIWDGGTLGTNTKIYLNGIQVDDTDASSGAFTAPYSGSDLSPMIGGNWNTTFVAASGFYPGMIEDVRCYNRVLSQAEILSIVAEPFRPTNQSNLYQKFWPGIDTLGWIPRVAAAPTIKFRRTLSPVGTRIGARQSQGWSQ